MTSTSGIEGTENWPAHRQENVHQSGKKYLISKTKSQMMQKNSNIVLPSHEPDSLRGGIGGD